MFSFKHFEDLGGRTAVDKALSRLAKKGLLRRVGRGLYDLPRKHSVFGKLSADTKATIYTVARKRGGRVQPSGAMSANLLGLSDQVPAQNTYYTDLPSLKIQIGPTTVKLLRRSPKQMALSEPAALVVSALRTLGKKHVPLERLDQLHQRMSPKDRKQLLKDLPLAPVWMHPHLRRIATGNETP